MLSRTSHDQRSHVELITVYEICRILCASLDIDRTFRAALNVLAAQMDLPRAMIVLNDSEENALRVHSSVGLSREQEAREATEKAKQSAEEAAKKAAESAKGERTSARIAGKEVDAALLGDVGAIERGAKRQRSASAQADAPAAPAVAAVMACLLPANRAHRVSFSERELPWC